MVKVFRVEDGRAQPLGGGEQRCVVVFELIAPRETKPCNDISLIDWNKRKRAEKHQPLVDDGIGRD